MRSIPIIDVQQVQSSIESLPLLQSHCSLIINRYLIFYMRRLQQLYSLFTGMGGEQSTKTGTNPTDSTTKEFKHPLVGLQNRTNTVCYANSILQVLYYNQTFRDLILSQTQATGGIMYYMNQLYTSISKVKKAKSVGTAKRLMSYVQSQNQLLEEDDHQDGHEFFIWLINQVNDELVKRIKAQKSNYSQKTHPTLLEQELFGTQTTRTTCHKCKSVSERDELQVDLSLHLPEPNVSLSQCIKNFGAKQYLKEQNKFFCDICKSLQNAQKVTLLKTLPRYLTVHLKRFKYDDRIRGLSKISSHVSFPLQLKIKTNYNEKSSKSYMYNLYAIVVHLGQGNRYGHYIAVVKINGRWIQFNDDEVEFVDEQMIEKLFGGKGSSMCAYMLFYDRGD